MTKKKIETERDNFQFRGTKEEKARFKEDAREMGMNATDYFKWLAFHQPPKTPVATPDRKEFILMNAQLGKIGSNLNQIAKVMNTEKKTYYSVAVREDIIKGVLANVQTVSWNIFKKLNYGIAGQTEREWQPVSRLPLEEGG